LLGTFAGRGGRDWHKLFDTINSGAANAIKEDSPNKFIAPARIHPPSLVAATEKNRNAGCSSNQNALIRISNPFTIGTSHLFIRTKNQPGAIQYLCTPQTRRGK
jgi:hypothetical protein